MHFVRQVKRVIEHDAKLEVRTLILMLFRQAARLTWQEVEESSSKQEPRPQ